MTRDLVLRFQATGLLSALKLNTTEANIAKVMLVLRTVDRQAKEAQAQELARMQALLDDANRMVARMSASRVGQ